MLFGFLLVRALVALVKGVGRLPHGSFRPVAAAMNAGTRPFHVLNYLCALPGSMLLGGGLMTRLMDRTIGKLRASLGRESAGTLALAMHFPTGWDPYFKEVMTVAESMTTRPGTTTTTGVSSPPAEASTCESPPPPPSPPLPSTADGS
jgi:hypothetical protein